MRPLPGSSTFSGHASSGDGATDRFTSQFSTPQMSFIIADETTVETSLPSPCHIHSRARDRKHPNHNQIPAGTASSHDSSAAPPAPAPRPTLTSTSQPREAVQNRPSVTSNRSPTRLQTPPPPTPSQPMTPILYGVSGPCSAISSSSSRRNSLAGSLSEYQESFVMSAFGASESSQAQSPYIGDGDHQFIMPTISVPSRRPFTEVGKSLGRLKLLVAGKSGLGKTSLIKAITQSCPHVVHVDPTVPIAMASTGLLPTNALPSGPLMAQGNFQITKTLASTKPYPPWWKEPTSTSSLSGSDTAGDLVLDRNVCFVDTPGYQETCRPYDTVGQVSHYVESQLQRSRLDDLDDSNALRTIGAGGGRLVDAVLYMISLSGLSTTDLRYIHQLQSLTNVVPLLAQADLLTAGEVAKSKERIIRQLADAGLDLFTFTSLGLDAAGTSNVFAISSKTGTDDDVMDASILMSPEYVQPLVPTDLSSLVHSIFSFDGAACLRHNAAKKLLGWRRRHAATGNASFAIAAQAGATAERRLLLAGTGLSAPLTVSRVSNHSQHEERFCRLQLTNWAADLQRSLVRERLMRERRSPEQSSVWLRGKWREVDLSSDDRGLSMALARTRVRPEGSHSLRKRRHSFGQDVLVKEHDPLGLLQLRDFRWKGTLEMVGGIGIVSGLAWLLIRG
ncbi:heat shock protein [Colletotrichum kahawae]|uniref:Heat shock protein n=1 Tax=Colletotrichum kahawae TaxID=34407 RepID=A0AAD9YF19_COLKA|nr:heat shock protein [Colletotrichum kahawae]